MSVKAKALPGAATPDRAKSKDLGTGLNSTNIVPQDNWNDKTAERVYCILGRIYLDENNLDGTVTVTKREHA